MNSTSSQQKRQSNDRIVNHKILRQGTGIIAFLLPVLTYLLSGTGEKLTSISESYWTDSGDIFVGSLVAVAFFLAAYNGTGSCQRDSEYMLSKLAGLCALFVAFFPTSDGLDTSAVPRWVEFVANGQSAKIHNIAAILLFFCLFWLITFFARRAYYKGKVGRSNLYTTISWAMAIGLPLTYFIVNEMGRDDSIFWVEFVGLWLFGFGWLVAGTYKTDPKSFDLRQDQLIKILQVDASKKNFPTGIKIKPGTKYIFKASGCWKDWFISCGPNGWGPKWKWFTSKNRLTNQPFFMLCGNINKECGNSSLIFQIGHEKEWIAPLEIGDLKESEQMLYLFANDWENKYFNNSGFLTVEIYELN